MMSKAHLFPHSNPPEAAMKRIIAAFGSVRMYVPWFLEPLIKYPGLEVVNPPENLKPMADIKAILSGYRQWTEQNRDKGVRDFFKFSEKVRKDDGSTWEIRRLLKTAAAPVSEEKEKEEALKWNILLHLAGDVERQNFDVMEMARLLKKKKNVLADAIQEPDEAEASFNGMQDLASGVQDNLNIELILDAWFGLFGGYLEKNDLLITCSRQVVDYISSRWEEEQTTKALPGNPEEIPHGLREMPGVILTHFPISPADASDSTELLLKYIVGKTIIFMPLGPD